MLTTVMKCPVPLVATLLILSSVAAPAGAYSIRHTDGGQVVRWRTDRLEFRFDESLRAIGRPEEVEEILRDAMETWTTLGLVDLDIETSEVEGAQVGYAMSGESSNDVVAIRHDWPFEEDAQAVTIVTYDPYTGDLIDADIAFNAERWTWTTRGEPRRDALDLQDVATHELGHALGLEHSEVPEATMYRSSPLGSIERRTLDDDDLDAVGAAYDPATDRVEAGCSAAGRGSAGSAAPILVALLLAASRRRRVS
jgi:uncharacterized protein (TIGR03382 family)